MHSILVAGVPRGGTTWVGSVLGTSDRTAYVHEPDGTHDPFAFRAKLGEHHHPMLDPGDERAELAALWAGVFAGGRPAGGVADVLARRAFARLSGEQKLRARVHGERPPLVRVALAGARPRAARADVDHVVAKTVNAAFCLEWIAARHPTTSVIVVTRHPFNVVASWRDFGWQPPQSTMYEAIRARAAERWQIELPPPSASALVRSSVMAASLAHGLAEARSRHPEWVQVAHEDLCVDPTAGFRALAAAVGLPFGPAAEQHLLESNTEGTGYATQRVAAEQPDSWRRRLAPDEIETITDVLARFPGHDWLDALDPAG